MSSAKTKTYRTFSSEETKALGFETARTIGRTGRGPAVIALQGDLGAGKTTFVQGFLKGLGSRARVTSPTFILMRRHKLAPSAAGGKRFSNVFHIDAYRLKKPEHLSALELEVILTNPRNIILIEWPEQAKKFLPKDAMWVRFGYGKKENERIVTVAPPAGVQ
jgi:tRNA threonylcarbamoyladenosine biosynthesis protein TsaE